MDFLLYLAARSLVAVCQALPLRWVARLGRCGGALAHAADGRHRRVAIDNLTHVFGADLDAAAIRRLARENFKRIGENFACAVKTASMDSPAIAGVCAMHGALRILHQAAQEGRDRWVVAIGHFGNFELYAKTDYLFQGYTMLTTFRGLRQPALDRLLLDLRSKSACRFYERRTQARELKAAMNQDRVVLGLLADQHAGNNGLRLPFLGRDCSTTAAPAVFALRYNCRLTTAVCERVGLARWRIVVGDEIPIRDAAGSRRPEDIMADVNRAFETAIRRDPANWFWVHKRWKSPPRPAGSHPRPPAPSRHATGVS